MGLSSFSIYRVQITIKPALLAGFDLFCGRVISLLGGDYADERAVLTALVELHNAVDEGVEGVILTHADILAGIVDGAALTDDDVARDALLTTEDLNAKSFAFAFATVTGTTNTFFVCHDILLLKG